MARAPSLLALSAVVGAAAIVGGCGGNNKEESPAGLTRHLEPVSRAIWPMVGHDSRHTGRTGYVGPTVPERKWAYTLDRGQARALTIGADGTVYSGVGSVIALKPDGTLRWSHHFTQPFDGADALAVTDRGVVYVAYYYARAMTALQVDGTQQWRNTTKQLGDSAPIIGDDGTVYVGSRGYDSPNGALYSFKPDGTQQWRFTTAGDVGTPTLSFTGDVVYVPVSPGPPLIAPCESRGQGQHGCWLYAIKANILLWLEEFAAPLTTVIASRDTLYAASTRNILYALNPTTGDERWHLDLTSYPHRRLYAVSPNGSALWHRDLDVSSAPAVDGRGTIYIGGDGKLYALRPNGDTLWTLPEPTVSIAIGNHRLYLATSVSSGAGTQRQIEMVVAIGEK